MFPVSFEYHAARSMDEALDLLTQYGDDAKLLAGGHSLIPAMKLRLSSPRTVIDLGQIASLRGVKIDSKTLTIGALTLHSDVAASDIVRAHLPALADAASLIGDMQVRNRGTIGGSVVHADPGADYPVILTALDASFVLVSHSGRREVSTRDFFVDYFTTATTSNEILTEVRIPLLPSGSGSAYVKLGHPATGYVVVSAGAMIVRQSQGVCESARIAVGGMGSGPIRATGVENALKSQSLVADVIAAAALKAPDGTDPDGDTYASADYKRNMSSVFVRRAIEKAIGGQKDKVK